MWHGHRFPKHTWSLLANTVVKWHSSDSESLFEAHTKDPEKNNLLAKFGWLDAEIQYRFNSQGFRCDEFDSRPCAIALGCSHTHGTGLQESNTWPVKLSQQLNLHVWNLGISSGAYDTVFRLAEFYIPFLKPKFVFVFEPPDTRFEYRAGNVYKIASVYPQFPELIDNPFIKYWFSSDENSRLNATRNRMAVAHLSHCNNAQFVCVNHTTVWQGPTDLARDLMHPGVAEQEKVANYMLEQIQK